MKVFNSDVSGGILSSYEPVSTMAVTTIFLTDTNVACTEVVSHHKKGGFWQFRSKILKNPLDRGEGMRYKLPHGKYCV